MNVLYIITKLELGGAQKVCLTLAKGVQENGYNSFLITAKEGKLLNQAKELNNVILLDSLKRETSIKNLILEIKNFLILISKIRNLKKQYPNLIVHTHSTKAGIIGRWAAFFAGVSIRIHTVHGFAFHKHQNKLICFFIYFCELITSLITTKFICVSKADIQLGKKCFPLFNKKHSLIRAAVETKKFTCAKKIKINENFIFGTVSCFKKQKNLIDLLKAFEIVSKQNNNCRLEIIGDGQLRTQLMSWITEHNLNEKIMMHGWQENVSKKMIHWDAFVLSSLWEGLPCAVVEARLLKLPVISYDTGGINEVIFDNKNGFICNQKDYFTLANRMLELSQNLKLYNLFQNYSDSLIEFDNIHMLKKHIDLYKSLN